MLEVLPQIHETITININEVFRFAVLLQKYKKIMRMLWVDETSTEYK